MMVTVMTLDEILDLHSHDYWCPVRSCLDDVLLGEFHGIIRERMREDGINAAPIWAEGGTLYNGHHRVKLACEIGLEKMNVTDNMTEHDRLSPHREIV